MSRLPRGFGCTPRTNGIPIFTCKRGEQGVGVEFDGVGPTSMERHVELTKNMRGAGLLDHVLLSHDAGWYSVGQPRGGKIRGFETSFTTFLTALDLAGFSEDDIKQLIVTNPANALAIGVRSA